MFNLSQSVNKTLLWLMICFISITSRQRWSSYIVDYPKNDHTNPKNPKHRKVLITIEAQNSLLINDKLYY